uniref:Transmembrane protein 14C n=1 Tax=Homalodisca liturata TaxID=320908 RepID=A0A1B6I392_9HEMI
MELDYLSFVYAAFVLIGGIVGYVKAGSVISLLSGAGFGLALGFGGYQASQDPENVYTLLGVNAALAGLMSARFASSGKIMPAGIITVLRCFTSIIKQLRSVLDFIIVVCYTTNL